MLFQKDSGGCCLTDDILVHIASGEVKVALGKPLLNKHCVENVAGIAGVQEKNVRINPLGQVLSQANSRAEAADMERCRRPDISQSMHVNVPSDESCTVASQIASAHDMSLKSQRTVHQPFLALWVFVLEPRLYLADAVRTHVGQMAWLFLFHSACSLSLHTVYIS